MMIGGVFVLATLLSAAVAQVTTRVHLGSVLPTSAALTTTMTNAVTAVKPTLTRLNGSSVEFILAAVNATQLPIADSVRILLADSREFA